MQLAGAAPPQGVSTAVRVGRLINWFVKISSPTSRRF